MTAPVLVLGIGNDLLGDDAAGVAALDFAGCLPGRLALAGIVPESVTPHYGLTPAIDRRIDDLVRTAREILHDWTGELIR